MGASRRVYLAGSVVLWLVLPKYLLAEAQRAVRVLNISVHLQHLLGPLSANIIIPEKRDENSKPSPTVVWEIT